MPVSTKTICENSECRSPAAIFYTVVMLCVSCQAAGREDNFSVRNYNQGAFHLRLSPIDTYRMSFFFNREASRKIEYRNLNSAEAERDLRIKRAR